MANVCVIGLGRIGLPLALLLANAGHRVIGVDKNPKTLKEIRERKLNRNKAGLEQELLEKLYGKNLFVTEDLDQGLSESDSVFVAIGTSVGADGTPDLSNLFNLLEEMSSSAGQVKGKLFVFKSTLPIGTTRQAVSLFEERTALKGGRDFHVVFCPERVLGDRAITEMAELPKIIGGLTRACSEKAAKIYRTIGGKIVIVNDPESAEIVKLLDNAFRQTLFAFANDFALLAESQGINAYELIKVANDNYPRNRIPFPSGGVSGYCLTKDPLYLESSFKTIAQERGFPSVWYSARKTNDYMPIHITNLLRRRLEVQRKTIEGANLLVCGVAYKENTDDVRSSHGLEIASRLRKEGANVMLWDPHVHDENLGFEVVEEPDCILHELDAMIFTVKHDEFVELSRNGKIVDLLRKMRTPILIDGWGIFTALKENEGVYYSGVGLPNNE